MNDDLKRWNTEAEDWVKRFQKTRTLPIELITNYLVGNRALFKDKKILDVGCGDGIFTQVLKDLNAEVSGIDGSEKMIEYAKALHPNINFQVVDALGPMPYESDSYHVITNFFLLMSLDTIEKFVSESYRLLKNNGRFISAVLHPAFNFPTMKPYRTYIEKVTGKQVNGLIKNYFQKTTSRKDAVAKNDWPFYHRTIEEYVSVFTNNGFLIKAIVEPHVLSDEYLAKYAAHEIATRLPRFLIFDCIKL